VKTVLLIDYDPRSIRQIRDLVTRRGCRFEVRRDGHDGLEAFAELRPSITVVQDLIPGKHGFEVCRQIKGSPTGHDRAVVLLTGARQGRERELRETQCDAFLRKPFDDDALLEVLEPWLEAPQAAPEATAPRMQSVGTAPLGSDAVKVEVEVPIELSELDIMDRLDAIMPDAAPAPTPERETPPPTPVAETKPTRSGSRARKPRAKKKAKARAKSPRKTKRAASGKSASASASRSSKVAPEKRARTRRRAAAADTATS
jgi:CheY-like chemotaxis protein